MLRPVFVVLMPLILASCFQSKDYVFTSEFPLDKVTQIQWVNYNPDQVIKLTNKCSITPVKYGQCQQAQVRTWLSDISGIHFLKNPTSTFSLAGKDYSTIKLKLNNAELELRIYPDIELKAYYAIISGKHFTNSKLNGKRAGYLSEQDFSTLHPAIGRFKLKTLPDLFDFTKAFYVFKNKKHELSTEQFKQISNYFKHIKSFNFLHSGELNTGVSEKYFIKKLINNNISGEFVFERAEGSLKIAFGRPSEASHMTYIWISPLNEIYELQLDFWPYIKKLVSDLGDH